MFKNNSQAGGLLHTTGVNHRGTDLAAQWIGRCDNCTQLGDRVTDVTRFRENSLSHVAYRDFLKSAVTLSPCHTSRGGLGSTHPLIVLVCYPAATSASSCSSSHPSSLAAL